ncbi:MAG: trans-sulfuration enzyme family protein [Gammaproteobacteria bacterium]
MKTRPSPPSLSPATRVVQAMRRIDDETGAIVPGIELSTTFARDAGYAPRRPYVYARDGGPTVEHAEAILRMLDGGAASMLFSSGMGGVCTMLETLSTGDHVVAQSVMYHGVIDWLHRLEDRRSIVVSFFDQAKPGALAASLRPGKTRVVWVETPANPSWDIVDIAAAAEAAHSVGAALVVDSTAAPPCTSRALQLGADYVFQSATKYLGGHSDLTAGVLTCREMSPVWEELETVRKLTGAVISPLSAWLLIRGLRTLFLRYERASDSALAIARYFESHPAIERVLYPGLDTHPGHAVAARQMTHGFGGMLSMLLRGGEGAARDFARNCQVFVPATSLGGVESLIEHRKAVEGPHSVVPGNLVRLSVGIEDCADLIADLEQSLERAG